MGLYWDDLLTGFFTYARDAYSSLAPWDMALFFTGIIAFIYLLTQSATAAVVVILIIVGLYGSNVLIDMPDLMFIFYIFVLLTLTTLFAFLFIKRRN